MSAKQSVESYSKAIKARAVNLSKPTNTLLTIGAAVTAVLAIVATSILVPMSFSAAEIGASSEGTTTSTTATAAPTAAEPTATWFVPFPASTVTTGQCEVLRQYCLDLNYTTATVQSCVNSYSLMQKTALLPNQSYSVVTNCANERFYSSELSANQRNFSASCSPIFEPCRVAGTILKSDS